MLYLQEVKEESRAKRKTKRGAEEGSDTEEASGNVRKRIKKGKKGKGR